jgi:bifunctional DNA-binding transcriptional regulator/antitoxin component of YhaV-PrlF toxin-antitoxin module
VVSQSAVKPWLKRRVSLVIPTRVFARVDTDGKIALPDNIRRQTGLQPGQLVEVKVVASRSLVISARGSAR